MEPITNKGYLGVILMRALKQDYQTAQESLDYIRAVCKHHGYTIVVKKNGKDIIIPEEENLGLLLDEIVV